LPTTVRSIFNAAGLHTSPAVRWGSPVSADAPGVYVIALTGDVDGDRDLV